MLRKRCLLWSCTHAPWDITHRQFQSFALSLMSYGYLHIIKSRSGTQPVFKTGMHTNLHGLEIFNRAQSEPCRRRKHTLGAFLFLSCTRNEQNIPPWNMFSLLAYLIFAVDSAVNHNNKKYVFGGKHLCLFFQYKNDSTVS